MSKKIAYERGGDNVFADLGVRDPEEALLRARLVREIGEVIARKRLSQTQIARLLGIDQSKVSKLVRGRISGFGSGRLFRYLTALGCDVTIKVVRKHRSRGRGRMMVATA